MGTECWKLSSRIIQSVWSWLLQLFGESQISATIPWELPPPSCRELIPVLILSIPQLMPSFQRGESLDPLPLPLVRSPYP